MFRRRGSWVLFLSTLFLGLFVYRAVVRAFAGPIDSLPNELGNSRLFLLFLALSGWLHAWYSLGLSHSIALLGITVSISWAFEQVGVETGWVYGAYHYTEVLGPKAGHVPLLIPVCWFMMGYPSLVIASLIVDARPTCQWISDKRWLLASMTGALVMTGWDVAMDPLMSSVPHGAWEWHVPGPYYGVAMHNFAGWILTAFAIHGAYRLYARRWAPLPLGTVTMPAASVPIWIYAAMMVVTIVIGGPPGLTSITGLVMGAPILLALARWLHSQ